MNAVLSPAMSLNKPMIHNQYGKSSEHAKAQLLKYLSKKLGQNVEMIVIKECIGIEEHFSNYEAHKLDLITPQ